MLTYDEAMAVLCERVRPLGVERAPVDDCAGRVLADNVYARIDSPPFDRSAMDGFAVRSADVQTLPVDLRVVGESFAGDWPRFEVEPGQCARIATGAPVPPGVDMVVMVEHTAETGDGTVRIERLSGGNICFRGEDVRTGRKVLNAGTRLTPLLAGVAAGAGHRQVPVYRRPRAVLFCTGAEVVEPPQPAPPGKIYNSNAPLLLNLLHQHCEHVEYLGIVGDRPEKIAAAVRRGLRADLLVVTGGVSVGERDLVPGALAENGVETLFHKLAIRPGKPVLFGMKGAKHVFGLPGNPFACFAVERVLVRPAVNMMCGAAEHGLRWKTGVLAEDVRDRSGRQTFLPCRVEQDGAANRLRPVEWHGSGDIAGAAAADALMEVPLEMDRVPEGAHVRFTELSPY